MNPDSTPRDGTASSRRNDARPSSPPALERDAVHIWHYAFEPSASSREITTTARDTLGTLLAGYAGLDRAPDIARDERGKPHAPALPDLDFNMSHTRNHVAFAFARGQPIGIDIERLDRTLDADALARRYFAAGEAEALAALPETARIEAFLRIWTCKEAIVKAIGAGIAFGLQRVVLDLDAGGGPIGLAEIAAEAGPARLWRLHALEPAPGFVGAVAWHGPPRRIEQFLGNDA